MHYLSLKNVFEIPYVIALDRIRLGTGRRFDILRCKMLDVRDGKDICCQWYVRSKDIMARNHMIWLQ